MTTMFNREGMNIFPGTDMTDRSKHLTLTNLTLPDLEEKTVEHRGGGAIGALDIGTGSLNALMVKFKLGAIDAQAMGLFGIGAIQVQPYTIYGVARDKLNGGAFEEKVIIWGRMTKLAANEFKRGDQTEQDHEIKQIIHYEYYFNTKEIFWYDVKSNDWRVNGASQNGDANAILRIGG
jgi:phage tail tube protein FII